MKNKNTRQFKSTEEIEIFLAEKNDGTLDNIYENITDGFDEENEIVEAFNKSLNSLAELIS
jgi:hypothetical protein